MLVDNNTVIRNRLKEIENQIIAYAAIEEIDTSRMQHLPHDVLKMLSESAQTQRDLLMGRIIHNIQSLQGFINRTDPIQKHRIDLSNFDRFENVLRHVEQMQ